MVVCSVPRWRARELLCDTTHLFRSLGTFRCSAQMAPHERNRRLSRAFSYTLSGDTYGSREGGLESPTPGPLYMDGVPPQCVGVEVMDGATLPRARRS